MTLLRVCRGKRKTERMGGGGGVSQSKTRGGGGGGVGERETERCIIYGGRKWNLWIFSFFD